MRTELLKLKAPVFQRFGRYLLRIPCSVFRDEHAQARIRNTQHGTRSGLAFTLLELLTVIAIIGVLAAITVPNLGSFKPNVVAAATRQLLDDVARARQLAISQRTTVYMVFVPPNFWSIQPYPSLPPVEQTKGAKLNDKQLTTYTFVTLRSVGDQPGRGIARYLGPWKSLPQGTFIATNKFADRTTVPVMNIYTNGSASPAYLIYGFSRTNTIPFPSAETPPSLSRRPYAWLPYVAFDYLGRLVPQQDEFIPLVQGSVIFRHDKSGNAVALAPSILESPPGNSTNAFNLIKIDALTGRARVERQEVR